ncbi:MAG: hypothetical protein AAF665_09080 [Pseudomonadota bacterium]
MIGQDGAALASMAFDMAMKTNKAPLLRCSLELQKTAQAPFAQEIQFQAVGIAVFKQK